MRRHRRVSILIAAASLALLVAGSELTKAHRYYPLIGVGVTNSLKLTFLLKEGSDRAKCEAVVEQIAAAVLAQCEQCVLLERQCAVKLSPRQRRMLYGHSLDTPVVRTPGGTLSFEGDSTPLSLQICVETERRVGPKLAGKARCIPGSEDALRVPLAAANAQYGAVAWKTTLSLLALGAAFISFCVCYLLIYSETLHSKFSYDEVGSGPQKFHATPTSRIGGLAITLGLCGSLFLLGGFGWLKGAAVYGINLLALAAMPAFIGGLAEDLTKRIGVIARLLLTFIAALTASLLLGAIIDRTGIPLLDYALHWPVLAIAFTVFAVGAIANAVNIVDGYNGLASGYAVLVLLALAFVAGQVGDHLILTGSFAMIGAVFGFLLWNYPAGRIFMGDGGAYLLGFWLAELCVLLVVRNPDVSPWFAVLLLAYPTMETSVSVYRKKVLRGRSPGQPDRLHLHMLIHQRLARINVGSKDVLKITRRNSTVAVYIWLGTAVFVAPSLLTWRNDLALISQVILFATAYLWLYLRLIRWRAPTYLIKSSPN